MKSNNAKQKNMELSWGDLCLRMDFKGLLNKKKKIEYYFMTNRI